MAFGGLLATSFAVWGFGSRGFASPFALGLALGFALPQMGPSSFAMSDGPFLLPEEVPAIPPCLRVAGAAQVQPCAGGVGRVFPGALGALPRHIVMANGHGARKGEGQMRRREG